MNDFAPLLRSSDRKPVRYLIVDDSAFARRSLVRLVESFGGQVAAEAGDGCAAIDAYNSTRPDIVLMDVSMPRMEGMEAAERIVQSHPEARIIMVSSLGYQQNVLGALQKGARHFLQKPVKPAELHEVIRLVLGAAVFSTEEPQEARP